MRSAELARLLGAKRLRNGEYVTPCPLHDDHDPSCHFRDGTDCIVFTCFPCGETCSQAIAEAIASKVNARVADFFWEPRPAASSARGALEATYDYTDETGVLLHQTVRYAPKQFKQRRPDGACGWIWTLGDGRRVVYHLPDLQGQATVSIAEGERDADRIRAVCGWAATTCPMGAGKWRDDYTAQLVQAGVKHVVIFGDNDTEGLKHAASVARACCAAGLTVRIPMLPDLPDKGDISDWFDLGHTKDELVALIEATAPMEPERHDAPPRASPSPPLALTCDPYGDEFVIQDPLHHVDIQISAVHEGREGIQAELAICEGDVEIHWGRLNLVSTSTREALVKKLATVSPAVPWREIIERTCRLTAQAIRQGSPTMILTPKPLTGPEHLVYPVMPMKMPTVLYGDGGVGKGYTAVALVVAMLNGATLPGGLTATAPTTVMYLDWESDEDDLQDRLYMVSKGLGLSAEGVLYRRMTRPLSDEAPAIRADISRYRVGGLVVDSLAPASGPEPEGADAAMRTYGAIRSFGPVSTLVIAHVNKVTADQQRGTARPFGSVFVRNIPRSTWEQRASAHDHEDELTVGLYHWKVNRGRKHRPIGLRFRFGDDAVTLTTADLDESPDLLARTSLLHRLKAALKPGPRTVEALAKDLGASESVLRKILSRHKTKNVFAPVPDTKPQQWALGSPR